MSADGMHRALVPCLGRRPSQKRRNRPWSCCAPLGATCGASSSSRRSLVLRQSSGSATWTTSPGQQRSKPVEALFCNGFRRFPAPLSP
eukprot:9900780-Alexandrium_andersonii.AAC.1